VSLNLTTEAIMRAYLFTCDIGRFPRPVLLIAQAIPAMGLSGRQLHAMHTSQFIYINS